MDCPAIVTEKEVIDALRELNANKASGSDEITNRFIKTCENALIVVLIFFFKFAWISNIIHGNITKTTLLCLKNQTKFVIIQQKHDD